MSEVILKKYANRRLYHTETKKYINLDGLPEIIAGGSRVKVIDNASGKDITSETLTQAMLSWGLKQERLLLPAILCLTCFFVS